MTNSFKCLILCSAFSSGLPLAAQNYTFQVVDYCGALTAFPSAINNSGVIVGAASAINSAKNSGFIYAQGKCFSTSFGGQGTDFVGITNSNEILGILSQTSSYLLGNGTLKSLPSFPSAVASSIYFKNAAGVLGGNYLATERDVYGRGFLYVNGAFKPLPQGLGDGTGSAYTLYGLNDNNIAVGTFYGEHSLGFVLRDGVITYPEYPGATYTYFYGINNNNLIVGSYDKNSDGTFNVFTYDLNTNVWTDLNFPYPYDVAKPVGINDSGVIAAMYTPSGGLLIATPSGN